MATNQSVSGQVLYNDRWVDKKHFRAFVYNGKEQKLANSYQEYSDLISSGVWFVSRLQAEIAIENAKQEALKVEKEEAKQKVKEALASFTPVHENKEIKKKPELNSKQKG